MPNTFSSTCCAPQAMEIFIASGTANFVNVDVYGGSSTGLPVHQQQKMLPNTIWTLSSSEPSPWINYNTEQAAYYAIHVYSSNPVVVYGYQYTGPNTSSTDSYLAMPTPALGTEYYPSCYYDDQYTLGPSNPLAGQFLIISPFDNNVVTIGPVKTATRGEAQPQTPGAVTISHQQGDTWNVTLMKGQTYLVQSTGLNYGNDDITGTHITSTQPIALLSGHQLCSIPIGELADQNGSKDEVMEMIPPLQAWGSTYFDMPTATRSVCGDLVRVIAGEDGEQITATSSNGSPSCVLAHAGDFYDFELVTDPTVFSSKGGKKFLAVQMAYSQNYDGDPGLSDPFSIVLTPQQQFQKKMIFNIPDRTGVPGFVHYGTFLCQTDSIRHIQINGKPITFYIPAGSAPIPGTTPPLSAYRVQWPGDATVYVATCGAPFGCYLYGWSTYESYGHPAGMALGIPSPDTLPPLEKRDSLCGNFQVELMELRRQPIFSFDDTRISDIQMITDTLDPRWPQPSYNYSFQIDPAHPFHVGDSVAFFDLTVINPSQNAFAAVWTTDRAGNDTVYKYHYTAPRIISNPGAPFVLKPVRVTFDSCQNLVFTNGETGALQISGASIIGPDSAGTFTVSPTSINRALQPNDTLQLRLCFTPSDTLVMNDTLALGVGCATFKYPLVGLGITPLIVASDVDFGNVTVGTTSAPHAVTVQNVGTAALTLDKNWKLDDNADFQFADQNQLPVTLNPGKSTTLNFTFSPQATGPYSTLQHWGTDLPTPFAHQIKDTSVLTGIGVQAGLNWDRPKQNFTTECSNPIIDTVYLENPTSGTEGTDILVDSIVISGPDAAEFSIAGWQFASGKPWLLQKNASDWVALQFTPDLSKQYIQRSATITAYGSSGNATFKPSIALTGIVRHATIRITPNSYDFGTVKPGDSVGTTFWIHNDGDTTLVLSNLSINGGFTISGFTPNEQVRPGDSAMVIIYMNKVPAGASIGFATAIGMDSACTPSQGVPLQAHAQFFAVASTGHDFGSLYVCQNGSAQVLAEDTGSLDAILINARIIDTLDGFGASQYTFTNGKQTITPDTLLHGGQSIQFTVNFAPQIAGGVGAYIVYTWVNVSTNDTFITLGPLTGEPLHYVNTLSVATGATGGLYTAHPAESVTVPLTIVSSAGGLTAQSGIYGIRVILRFKRDMFVTSPWKDDNVHVVSSDTGTDPTDPAYVLDTVTLESNGNTPITQSDSLLAHLPLTYVVNKDSVSSLNIIDPIYLDSTGQPACWVSHDTIPATFAGLDKCGDATLRSFLSGGLPTFKIQSITPNPVSRDANVAYSVRLDGVPLTMDVFDVLGQGHLTLMQNNPILSGQHTAILQTESLPAGSYVLRVTDGTTVQSVPFVVQK